MKNYKGSYILLLLLFLSFSVLKAQEFSKIGLELRHHLEQLDDDAMVPILAEAEGKDLNSIVEKHEGKVRLRVGNLYSIDIPARSLRAFSEEEYVKNIEFSNAPAHYMSDTMLIQTRAHLVQQLAAPLRSNYTGKGVILGVIDSGIELAHPDFQDSLGNTRVLYVWDQRAAFDPSRPALNYTYGVEWDSASINNNFSTHDDDPLEFGHGSMVTGAAASNANATGNFKGIAPEVNIISVATDFTKSNWLQTVAEAVDYIYTKADSLGMPCVINASIGRYLGSHDGEDIAARMIDQMIKAKNGRTLVAAAGNAGQFNFHLQHQPNQDTVFSWFEHESQLFSGQGGVYFQLWSDTADMKDLKFSIGADRVSGSLYEFRGRTTFDSIANRLNVIYTDSIISLSNNFISYVYTYAEESQGRYLVEVAIPQADSNQYYFRLETAGSGKLDIWSAMNLTGTSDIIRNNLPTAQQFPAIQKYVRSDSLQSMVSSFTCLPSVITVGNYINRNTYVDVSGTPRNMNAVPGQISPNSSLGPNRRGYPKPDISSAGDYMFSAGRLATMAATIQTAPARIAQDSLHMRNGGTSMAAPTVAGMIALYMEQCSGADYFKIKNDLLQSHRTDALSATAPDNKWGIGKADAMAYLSRNVFVPQIIMPLPDYCDGDTAFIGTTAYSSYRWSNGDTTAITQLTNTDSLFVEVSNGSCSSVSDTVEIFFKPSPAKPSLIWRQDSLIILDSGMYRWYRNGAVIAGENGPILTLSSRIQGLYYGELIAANGCSAFTDTINYIWVGINETPNKAYKLYPNPTENILNIDFHDRIEELIMTDQNGRIIYRKMFIESGQPFQIDMSQMEEGLYILQLKTFNSVMIEKVVKY